MSFDPVMGTSSMPTAPSQPSATPRAVFEMGKFRVKQLPTLTYPEDMTEEDYAYRHIAEMSQKTRFATGDIRRDVKNYLALKKIGRMMTGLLEDE
tara:strand:+ start:328 stop:612 length:285 start_codon:yes stop_codon:yes gene_type:complete